MVSSVTTLSQKLLMAAFDRSEQDAQAYKQAPDSGSPSSVTYLDLPVLPPPQLDLHMLMTRYVFMGQSTACSYGLTRP